MNPLGPRPVSIDAALTGLRFLANRTPLSEDES